LNSSSAKESTYVDGDRKDGNLKRERGEEKREREREFHTLPLMASNLKLSVQEALASTTLRLSSSNASNIETRRPGQLLSENTFIRNPFSRVSTVTCAIICSKKENSEKINKLKPLLFHLQIHQTKRQNRYRGE